MYGKLKKLTAITLVSVMVLAMCCSLSACKSKAGNGKKDTVVVGIQQALDGLDPHTVESAGTREVMFNIFEGLIKVEPDGNISCAIASDYKINAEGTVYTFTVREGVKFHDGSELKAEDIKYSIDRNAGLLENGGEALDSAFTNIEKVEIKDEGKTVEIVLKAADSEFISYLNEPIIKKDADKSAGVNGPVGTGAYKVVKNVAGDRLELTKFEDYWNKEKAANIKNVTFKVVTASAAIIEMKAGSIDVFPYITDNQANELKAAGFNIIDGNTNLVQALYLNHETEAFKDIKVRQALNYAIDKQEILDMVAGGKGTILGSGLFTGFGKYYKDCTKTYGYDKEKAEELLKEALGDKKLSFTVRVPSNYEVHMNTALVIQDQLKDVGVEMKIDAIDWSTWLDEVYTQGKYEATVVGIDAKLAPKDMMRRYYSEGSGNLTKYSNEEYDKLYVEAVATTDENKKVELYHKMQEILAQDAASVFIQDNVQLVAINKNLEGYTFYPIYVQDMTCLKWK